MAEENSNKARKKEATSAPGQKITESAKHRMTYGDINYLGSNKAFFYFDRGIRDCKCDSSNQHNEMFSHYRETCAVGLTCPARLSTTCW
ncbi:uncharacterized protein LOC116738637 [Nasonia vitripennis]|uniref:Uncharacterized protein n=1 Tax=Nasonia vitripennis TaxID=7425 RepID=A0A7M7TEB8_NASVI|nr:uncharacterized protein LOC116738637 [Nasonia vitripennis]